MNDLLQKISGLFLVSIRYLLPLGTIDPLMLSYLLFAAIALFKKRKVISGDNIVESVKGVNTRKMPL